MWECSVSNKDSQDSSAQDTGFREWGTGTGSGCEGFRVCRVEDSAKAVPLHFARLPGSDQLSHCLK